MSSPRFAPTPSIDESRSYQSPPAIARPWVNSRPGSFGGFQPVGEQLGFQGPDQGFALKIAHEMVPSLHLQAGEHAHDVVRGCLGLALRRASMFSRGPVVHDLTVAFTVWGYLNPNAPAELVAERRTRFAGLGHGHHYTEARAIVDMVPETTLRLTPAAAASAHAADWKAAFGL